MFAQKHVSERVQTGYIPVSAPFFIKKTISVCGKHTIYAQKRNGREPPRPPKPRPHKGAKSPLFSTRQKTKHNPTEGQTPKPTNKKPVPWPAHNGHKCGCRTTSSGSWPTPPHSRDTPPHPIRNTYIIRRKEKGRGNLRPTPLAGVP